MSQENRHWLDEVLLPCLFYKMKHMYLYSPYAESLNEFAERIIIVEHRCHWMSNELCVQSTEYALGFNMSFDRSIIDSYYRLFGITDINSICIRDIAFMLKKDNEQHQRFEREFHSKSFSAMSANSDMQWRPCRRIVDVNIPDDAVAQMRDAIEMRDEDEVVMCSSTVILEKGETCEEACINIDLNS